MLFGAWLERQTQQLSFESRRISSAVTRTSGIFCSAAADAGGAPFAAPSSPPPAAFVALDANDSACASKAVRRVSRSCRHK